MQPGTWAELGTSDILTALSTDGLGGSILGYAEDAAWDPQSRQLLLVSGDHLGSPDGDPPRFVAYSAPDNAWRILPQPFWVRAVNMHGYDHNALNPATGDFYHRPFLERTVYKYGIFTEEWSALPMIPESVMDYDNCCMGLEYFPELGGLILAGSTTGSVIDEVYFFREATQEWLKLGSGFPMGTHEQFVEYNPVHKLVLFGGGGGELGKNIYAVRSSGIVSPLGPAPIALGVMNAIVTVDPLSGEFLIFGKGGEFYRFDVIADRWSAVEAPVPIFSPAREPDILVWQVIAVPASTYGVVLFVKYYYADPDPRAWFYVYKHAPG
jgi:hypothetical protein